MSNFENITKKIIEKNERLAEMKKAYMEEMRVEFHKVIKSFFEECPEVQAVVWNQYTPYFNDGDPCTFRANEPYFIANGFNENELLDPYEYDDEYEVIPINLSDNIKLCEEYLKRDSNIEYWKKCLEDTNIKYTKWGALSDKCGVFAKILGENEDLLEEVYGDHVSVYVTKNRVIVEEYCHD